MTVIATPNNRTTANPMRKTLLTIAGTLVALLVSASGDVGASASKRTIVTLSQAMALPNVTLPPGTYTFEVLNPTSSADVVVVKGGGARGRVRFLGLTRRAERPRNLPANQVLSFGEAPAGEPLPIIAWYPVGFSSGHQFIY